MSTNFTDKAIELVKQAVEADNAQNYPQAFNLYKTSLEYFTTAIKYERNPKLKEMLTQRAKSYMDRAEQIGCILDGSTPQPKTPNGKGGEGGELQKSKSQKENGKDGEDAEMAKLRGALGGAVLAEKPNVAWDDVAGLDHAKDALKEAVILPVKFPQFFTGKRKPWRGFLLYGPPGTGKSYLAKAVATEADSTFFSVSSSDLVSKWMGESEKLVAQLFEMARARAPSIIFIDEIDSLCGSRGDGESEASRRIKTEFLVQMQGVGHSSDGVLILAATNLPYALDQAVRRRFDKRIYIPLPDERARARIFKVHLGDTPNNLSEADFHSLAVRTEGFSGSDIAVVVKDVLMQPLRVVQDATHWVRYMKGDQEVYEPCAPNQPGAFESSLEQFLQMGVAEHVHTPAISMRDFELVLDRARPTVSKEDLEVYGRFTDEFGEEG
mmetsp:Transcript_6693/g.24789  ORF Transcript_6693/g.24789 Transcript_6693/m.24789 type:complete len:438 (+) Transcript_6693:263-1576(+)